MSDVETNLIHTGDCFDVLPTLPNSSIHAVVSDPPYGLAFMGRSWDDFEPKEYQEWCEKWAKECLRVLKPGGHMLAFSGNRTHHRLFSGVEDAGFEIRDTLTWHYGSGFPKALDVSKAIDKAAGAEREVVKENPNNRDRSTHDYNSVGNVGSDAKITAPATDAAKRWDGFKTALKPSTEFVVMARKPFDATVAENIQAHGTGALNIGETRIDTNSDLSRPSNGFGTSDDIYGEGDLNGEVNDAQEGRYPSNLIFDETQANELDRQTDDTVSTGGTPNHKQKDERHDWAANVQESTGGLGDSGGVSRYFYTSKATKAERTLQGKIDNAHPTVKPQDLMEWLIKLVTAENQIVLDPFCGTGTTCKAAKELNRRFIGIEQQAKWADVARVRCGLTPDDPSVVRDDDSQRGLESF